MTRVLDPVSRVSEVLFGLIMVLTFTGSLSVATAGRAEVREMLIGALGCNIAWGIIDAILYLMGVLAEKGRSILTLRAVQRAADPEAGRGVVADALPPVLLSTLEPGQLETIRARLAKLPEPPAAASLAGEDWRGALGVFLLVFLSTFPVVIPFILFNDLVQAMRWSNGIALLLMFLSGHSLGKYAGFPALLTGGTMVAIGAALVFMIIALGG